MLVLSRNVEESIVIDEVIEIKILEIQGGKIRIGIDAPKKIPVHRKEVHNAIQRERAEAASTKQ